MFGSGAGGPDARNPATIRERERSLRERERERLGGERERKKRKGDKQKRSASWFGATQAAQAALTAWNSKLLDG
jgi:hypothetical protein